MLKSIAMKDVLGIILTIICIIFAYAFVSVNRDATLAEFEERDNINQNTQQR